MMMRKLIPIALVVALAAHSYAQDFGGGMPHISDDGAVAGAPTTTTTTLAVGTAADDWTAAFAGVWLMEEASNTTRTNEAATTCGSDCDVTDNNTNVALATTGTDTLVGGIWQGSGAAKFNGDTNERLQCTTSTTCEELLIQVGEKISFGCATYWTDISGDDERFLDNRGVSPAEGYRITTKGTATAFRIRLGTGADSERTANGTLIANQWTHVVGTADSTANKLCGFINGSASGAPCDTITSMDPGAEPFQFGDSGSGALCEGGAGCLAFLDECFVIHLILSDAEICRINRCGIDGALCTCDTGSPTTYKTCFTDADCLTGSLCSGGRCRGRTSGCVLPACNATDPT